MTKNSKQWRHEQVAKKNNLVQKRRALFEKNKTAYSAKLPTKVFSQLKELRQKFIKESKDPTISIPCSASLIDNKVIETCLLIFEDSYKEWIIETEDNVLVGGQVESLKSSKYTLPPSIVMAARQTSEYRMSMYEPLGIKDLDGKSYLLHAHSYFFKTPECTGKDIDPNTYFVPEVNDFKKGHYKYGDNMRAAIHYIICDEIDTEDHF